MNEKRFRTNIHRIYDNNEEIACADTMDDAEILVDLLNEQEEQLTTINEFVFTLLNKLDIQDAFIRDYFEIIKNCDLKRMNNIIQELRDVE